MSFHQNQSRRALLHLFFLLDSSGSMEGARIQSLNQIVRDLLPELQSFAQSHPECEITLRVIEFNSSARWLVGDHRNAPSLEQFQWHDLQAEGVTAMAQAIALLADGLEDERLAGKKLFAPVAILISDGGSTDPTSEMESALQRLNQQKAGRKALRFAIGIGDDYDEEVLRAFISPAYQERPGVLQAVDSGQLAAYLQLLSTSSITQSLGGNSGADGSLDPIIANAEQIVQARPVAGLNPNDITSF